MGPESKAFLPYGRHSIDSDDLEAVRRVLCGDWLTTGPVVEEFERAFAEKVGAKYALSCSSGTAGLHLISHALGLGPNDNVLVPSLTFLATANAPRYMGANVVFCDSEPESGLISEEAIAKSIDLLDDVAAVFPVHLNGQCANMEKIWDISRQHEIPIVEDACHALGATYSNSSTRHAPVGNCQWSDATVFSLHPVKTITMGEGGMVTTNDETLFEKMRCLRSHGMVKDASLFANKDQAFDQHGEPNPWYYEMADMGYNYRASDISCALGLSQLQKLDGFVNARMHLAQEYERQLLSLAPIVNVVERKPYSTPAWHLFVVLIDFESANVSRKQVVDELREVGIGTQVHYIPVHWQPYYRRLNADLDLPGATSYYNRCLSLPLFPGMTENDVERVVSALKDALSL